MVGFRSLYWGFFFMFDFRIQGIDVLPDIVGYYLIYSGLKSLILNYDFLNNTFFKKAKELSVPLIFLSILDIYEVQKPIAEFYFDFDPISSIIMIIGIISIILNLLLVYNICNGISNAAKSKGEYDLEMLAISRWKLYLYYQIAMIVIIPVSLLIPGILVILFLPIFLFALFIYVVMMKLMKEADILVA